MTCTCIDVDFGTYANQELRVLPFPTPRFPVVGTKRVGLDRCVIADVEELWALGIETVESCCGHGKTIGYIIVMLKHHDQMTALGYRPDPRQPNRKGLFAWPR